LILSRVNASCIARTVEFVSEFFTTNARLSSDEPWVIIDTLTLFFSIAAKTFDATPIVPLIPEPINAMIDTPVVTSNFLIIFLKDPSLIH